MRTSRSIFFLLLLLPTVSFAQPKALAELFSNFNCGNCEQPDSVYEYYLSSHPGVVLINYHNASGDNKDKFYLNSLPASQTRNDFYGIPGDPAASTDGIFAGSSQASEPVWEQNTTNDIALSSHLAHIQSSITEFSTGVDTISFTITGTTNTEVKYYVAIKESKLVQANAEAYGLPPGGLWNDIFRTMLPSGNGSDPFSLSGSHSFTVGYDPSNYSYTGVPENMTAVIFVQDVNPTSGRNYQVEAIDTISMAPSSGVAEATPTTAHLLISSNPLVSQGHIGFALPQSADVQLTVSDLLGHEIATLAKGVMPSGETSVEMSSKMFPPGCYFIRLTVDGHTMDVQKFIVTE